MGLTNELDRLMGGDRMSLASRSPEWDEWYTWPDTDQRRLRHFMSRDGAMTPDQLATDLGVSCDQALRVWRQACFVALDRASDIDAAEWEYSEAMSLLAEIIGPHEVAQLLEVAVGTVHQWAKRRSTTRFPMAARTVSGVPLWTREQILGWAATTGRVRELESF
jgi:hypothetical protein